MEVYILQGHIAHGIEKLAATVHHMLLPVCKLSLVFNGLPFYCKQSHEIGKQGLIIRIEHNPFSVMIGLGFIIYFLNFRRETFSAFFKLRAFIFSEDNHKSRTVVPGI